MTCLDLDAFFDGELTWTQSATMRGHIAECEACQKRLEGLMQEAATVAAERTRR